MSLKRVSKAIFNVINARIVIKKFSSIRRPKRQSHTLFQDYFYHRQTVTELALKYNHCERWVRQQIRQYQPQIKAPIPRAVTLVMDATFFGKRKDKFGVLVAKDVKTSQLIAYQFIRTEQVDNYQQIVKTLQLSGFSINSITIDAKKGLFQAFTGIPILSSASYYDEIFNPKT